MYPKCFHFLKSCTSQTSIQLQIITRETICLKHKLNGHFLKRAKGDIVKYACERFMCGYMLGFSETVIFSFKQHTSGGDRKERR